MPIYKYGKPNEEIDLQDLKETLEHARFVRPLQHKSYLVLLYWVGCRRTEPLAVKKEDVQLKGNSLFISIPAYKHGERGGDVELPLNLFGVELILKRWEKTRKRKRMWPFETSTAYRIIKRIWPKKSPHWLRHNRVTKLRKKRDEGEITTDDIKSYTGIKSDSTIERYGMKTKSGIHKVAKVLD